MSAIPNDPVLLGGAALYVPVPAPAWAAGDPYATDEQVYLSAPGDYPLLVPASGRIASGTDGVISEESPWTLTSESEDFSGVRAGMIVQLGPGGAFARSEFYAVAVAEAGSLVLRRPGFSAVESRAPAPAGATAVRFAVLTLLPQLRSASREFDRRLGVAGVAASASPDFDPLELEGAVVAYVLAAAYLAATENAPSQSASQGFAAKALWWTRRYEESVPRVQEGLRDDVPQTVPYRTTGVVRW